MLTTPKKDPAAFLDPPSFITHHSSFVRGDLRDRRHSSPRESLREIASPGFDFIAARVTAATAAVNGDHRLDRLGIGAAMVGATAITHANARGALHGLHALLAMRLFVGRSFERHRRAGV
jgi:hypothetical protein